MSCSEVIINLDVIAIPPLVMQIYIARANNVASILHFIFQNVLDNLFDAVYLVDTERRITYWNKAAERISGYSAHEVIGHHCFDNLLVHVDCLGTQLCKGFCPLAVTLADGQQREAEVFLHHKNGHRVPVYVHVSPLFDEEGHLIGAAEIFTDNSKKQHLLIENENLKKLALLDELTGIGNRRYAEMQIDTNLSEVHRYSGSFGFLFVDIDRFKNVNDVYGHAVGDQGLRMVAQALSGAVRSHDIVCRWGGEEFIALLKHVDADLLRTVAEKLRMLVETSSLNVGTQTVRVTVSIGGTVSHRNDTREALVQRADKLMYESKALGRNTVAIG